MGAGSLRGRTRMGADPGRRHPPPHDTRHPRSHHADDPRTHHNLARRAHVAVGRRGHGLRHARPIACQYGTLTRIATRATTVIATPTKTACRSLNISPSVISRTIRSTSYCLGTIQVKTTTEEMKPTTQPLSPNWGAAGTSVINKRNPAGTIGRTRRKAIPNSATL